MSSYWIPETDCMFKIFNTMKIEQILKTYECDKSWTVEKASVQTVDGDPLCDMELKTNDPDLPVVITGTDGQKLSVPNRDIPQFVKVLAAMCDENYF